MTVSSTHQTAKAGIGSLAKTANIAADQMAKGEATADRVIKAQREAVTESRNAALSGLQELTEAYQSLASKNAERLTASLRAFTQARTPFEFIDLQRKLASETVQDAIGDYGHLAELTLSVLTTSFKPMRKQAELLENRQSHDQDSARAATTEHRRSAASAADHRADPLD